MEEWRPQIERCLWGADCGAELGRFPSGHPVWRIPAENVHLLPETGPGQRVMGEGSGHGVPIKASRMEGVVIKGDFAHYDGVYEMAAPREQYWTIMVDNWQPIKEPKAATPKRGRKK